MERARKQPVRRRSRERERESERALPGVADAAAREHGAERVTVLLKESR